MGERLGTPTAVPCVWMEAGVVSYRLCDRDLDCEHCPLDAALRGDPVVLRADVVLEPPGRDGEPFPTDRLYGSGHTWVGAGDEGRVRIGLDGFAAGLIGACRGARCAAPDTFEAGDALCDLDVGIGRVTVRSPIAGRRAVVNPALGDDGRSVVANPYGRGWLVEMETDAVPRGLVRSAEAGRRAAHDLRRLRRRVAIELWSDAAAIGPTAADGGEPVSDLRTLLGGPRFLELVRDVLG